MLGLIAGPRFGHTQGPPPEKFGERHLFKVEPARGVDQVTLPDQVPWCSAPFTGTPWDGGRLGRSITQRND